MLLYLYGDSFEGQTFVLQADPSYSVERVKAQFLHLIRPLGVPFLTFDLTYQGEALSEGLQLSDYRIYSQTELRVKVYKGDEAADAEGAELLEAEIRELALVTKLSLLVKSCAVCLVALSMASFFSDAGYEMSWNLAVAACLLSATWKSRTFGLRAFLFLTPFAAAGNVFMQVWYYTSLEGRCRWGDGRVKWYCVPLTHAVLLVMLPFQAVGCLATLRFLKNLGFYPGLLFERRLKRARTLQAMLLAARAADREERRVAAKALAKYAAESEHNASVLVAEKALSVLRDLARRGDDNVKFYAASALNGIAADDASHAQLVSEDFLKDVVELARHRSDAVCAEAASAILRFTYEPADIEAVLATPGMVGTIRAVAMAREGEVQYYAKVAHENIENFQVTAGAEDNLGVDEGLDGI